ncbi:MAG: hypothetical protein RSC24_06255 [Clostridium sp.]
MNRKLNLKKGDKCIVATEKMSNVSRRLDMGIRDIKNWTYEGEVISAGRKYITVKFGLKEEKFVVDDDYRQKWTCGGADYKLYQSIQEVYEEREIEELNMIIKGKFNMFGNPNYSLDQLRRIKAILDETGSEI